MRIEEFNDIMAMIADAHPRRTYSRDQVLRLFDELSALPTHTFKLIIQTLLDTTSYHPTIHVIRQACRHALESLRSNSKVFNSCEKCGGAGQYDYRPRTKDGKKPIRYAIACPYCNAADLRKLNPSFFPRIGLDKFYETDDFVLSVREAREEYEKRGGLKGTIEHLVGQLKDVSDFATKEDS